MIKITIIIILIILLSITLYSYYCLSSRMINFERARLEYILQKENELAIKEKNIKVVADCSNKNEKFKEAFDHINKILGEIGINNSNKTDNKNNDIIKEIENIIYGKIDSNIVAHPEQLSISNINNVIEQSINTKILSEVPTEYINKIY